MLSSIYFDYKAGQHTVYSVITRLYLWVGLSHTWPYSGVTSGFALRELYGNDGNQTQISTTQGKNTLSALQSLWSHSNTSYQISCFIWGKAKFHHSFIRCSVTHIPHLQNKHSITYFIGLVCCLTREILCVYSQEAHNFSLLLLLGKLSVNYIWR